MEEQTRRWTEAMREERYADAWRIEQAVLDARDPSTRDDPALPYHRRWVYDGTPPDGRDVVVRCYHGLGDTIQFARYLPALAQRAASVTVEAPARLHPLLTNMGAALVPFDPARPLPRGDCDVEITELAFALRLAPDAVAIPYLSVAPAALPPRTIGLCYAAGDWDRDRWVPPALLAPLAAGRRCLSLVAEPTSLPVLNPDGCPFDLAATAALVRSCALVITVDTMIAHLAGALGRPTWLLLKAAPDWRWHPARRTTPWYPSMRLFTQPQPGEWAPVIAAVAQALDTFDPVTETDDGQFAEPFGSGVLG